MQEETMFVRCNWCDLEAPLVIVGEGWWRESGAFEEIRKGNRFGAVIGYRCIDREACQARREELAAKTLKGEPTKEVTDGREIERG